MRLWIRSAEVWGGTLLGEWEHNNNNFDKVLVRRMVPRTAAVDTFRSGSGGTSLGEREHKNNFELPHR